MSALSQRNCSAKSDIKAPVSTTFKIKFFEIQLDKNRRQNFVDLRVYFAKKTFCFRLLSGSTPYVGLLFDILKIPTLELADYSNFCCTQNQGRTQTVPYQDKWLMTARLIVCTNCKHFSDGKAFLLCFQVFLFRDRFRTPY